VHDERRSELTPVACFEPLGALLQRAAPTYDALELALAHSKVRGQVLGVHDLPITIGRFEIKRLIGAGGHGTVYEAFDPLLQRSVALKSISTARTLPGLQRGHLDLERARVQLLASLTREAQAIARVNDPRVVTVHDILRDPLDTLAGGFESECSVIMVMELIRGVDLRRWNHAQQPSPSAILSTFCECAKAIIAAHDVGLIHGDFKPENVMISDQGLVKILDFGTARAVADESKHASNIRTGLRRPNVGELDGIIGTVGYAAPEVAGGLAPDSQSDQYSFCAALFEALTGSLPQLDESLQWPSALRTPRFRELRALLEKGLSPNPSDRFATMAALLRELLRVCKLQSHETVRQRSWPHLGSALTVCVVLGLGAGAHQLRQPLAQPLPSICANTSPLLQWDASYFSSSGRGSATAMPQRKWLERVGQQFESFRRAWNNTRLAACAPTRDRLLEQADGNSHAAESAATRCLRDQEDRAMSWLAVLEREPDLTLESFDAAFAIIGAPASCLEVQTSTPPSVHPPVEAVCPSTWNEELFSLIAHLQAAPRQRDLAAINDLHRRFQTCASPQVMAWIEVIYGIYHLDFGDNHAAQAAYERALTLAPSGHFHLLFQAQLGLLQVEYRRGRIDALEEHITAMGETLHGNADRLGPHLTAKFYETSCKIRMSQGDYKRSAHLAQFALQMRELYWGSEHPLTLDAKRLLIDSYYKERRFAQAETLARGMLTTLEASGHGRSLTAAKLKTTLGSIAWRRGQYSQAYAELNDARETWASQVGPDEPNALALAKYIAELLVDAGQAPRAIESLRSILEVFQKNSRARATADTATILAFALMQARRIDEVDEALALADRAAAENERRVDPQHGYLAIAHSEYARLRGNHEESIRYCNDAIAIWRASYGEDSPKMSWAYTCLGLAQLEVPRQRREAIENLERAQARFNPDVDDPARLAKIEFGLARALVGTDHAKAQFLARNAASRLVEGSGEHHQRRRTILAWIRAHQPPNKNYRGQR
jgi:serine/threonine protein kinase/tetratricopeptide (TPR) repeat protein